MIDIAKRSLKWSLLAVGAVALAFGVLAAGSPPAAHAEGGYQVRLVATPVMYSTPSFIAPSGGYLAWTGSYKGVAKMYVYDLVAGKNTYINPGAAGSYYNPAADGRYVVFQGATTGGYDDIYLHDRQTGDVASISYVQDGDRNDWNPRIQDGRVVWEKRMADPEGSGIYLYDISSREKRRILSGPEYRNPDVWGRYVVCVKDVESQAGPNATQIILHDLQTAETTVIGGGGTDTNNEHPRIYDGKVVWSSGAVWSSENSTSWTTTYQVYLYDVAGKNTKVLTDDLAGNLNPAVGRDLVVWQTWTPSTIQGYRISSGDTFQVSGHGDAFRAPEVDGARVAWWGSRGLYYAVPEGEATSFPDVPTGHHYLEAIEGVAGKGIISGYGDGNFGPGDWLIHQQFAHMIGMAMAYPVTEDDHYDFTDRPPLVHLENSLYPYHYVAAAALKGVVVAYADGTYRPLYRERGKEAVTSAVVAAGSRLVQPPDDFTGTFKDQNVLVSQTFRLAEYNGLLDNIVGDGGTLRSWDIDAPATRAQIAQLLWNLHLKVHPPK